MMECGNRSHSAGKNGNALPLDRRPAAQDPRAQPPHAQEIFREAFNHAWEDYAWPSKRYAGSSLEETANRVAWTAVKRRYVKVADRWLPRE
jgi:cation transport regulator